MEIVGEKVVLRAAEAQDRELMQSLIEDPDITKRTGGYRRTNVQERRTLCFPALPDSDRNLCRVIAQKGCPETGLGIIMLTHVDREKRRGEIQIKLEKSVRGRGYGQDAVRALTSYAFGELRLDCIESSIRESNAASRRLFEKCGFVQERVQRGRVYEDGRYSNICLYRLKNPGAGAQGGAGFQEE